ncbi:hypothetical protein BC830DRAFT_1157821 [Chytriomyces sp. MP71]|nr:hypothetical protein BC830DRAFT_1157821 [Chytriomyces sp. MP71]
MINKCVLVLPIPMALCVARSQLRSLFNAHPTTAFITFGRIHVNIVAMSTCRRCGHKNGAIPRRLSKEAASNSCNNSYNRQFMFHDQRCQARKQARKQEKPSLSSLQHKGGIPCLVGCGGWPCLSILLCSNPDPSVDQLFLRTS